MNRSRAVLALAWAVPAAAAAQPAARPADDAEGKSLVQTFKRFCLDHFPEPARVEDGAPGELRKMPRSEVERYLHADPGRGWIYHADGGEYVLTVEEPPFHTCAVRRNYAHTQEHRADWLRVTDDYAASHRRGRPETGPVQSIRRGDMMIVATTRTLKGAVVETFIEITTTYDDGHVEQRLARTVGR